MWVSGGIGILQQRRDTGTLATLFWDIPATNGTFTAGRFDEIMSIVDGEEKVVFVKGEEV